MDCEEQYEFLDTLFLRAPFYSFEDYALERLPEILAEINFRNALWLASPDFYKVLEAKGFLFDRLLDKERFVLQKYYNRMSFRPVPFGAFASFTVLGWSETGVVRLSQQRETVLHLLPSREWQTQLDSISKQEGRVSSFIPNHTLYRFGNSFRYVKSLREPSGKLNFTLDAVAAEILNVRLLEFLQNRFFNAEAIIAFMQSHADCSMEEAVSYLDFLMEEQVLLTKGDTGLIESAEHPGKSAIFLDLLTQVKPLAQFLCNINKAAVGDHSLSAITDELEDLLPDVSQRKDKKYFYSALERPLLSGGIQEGIQEDIQRSLRMVSKLVKPTRSAALEEFIKVFKEKFDQQKVPLLLALDPDAGISYGDLNDVVSRGLLDNIGFPENNRENRQLHWSTVHQVFLKAWLMNVDRKPFDPVVIMESDLQELTILDELDSNPPSIAVMFRCVNDGLILESIGGVSATSLIGRFSVFSEEVHALCIKLAAKEVAVNPEVLFAEIHQVSDDHADNINRRRQVYDHVIPVNVFSDNHTNIHLNDLVVSVRGDELILESLSQGKRIIPRLPTAYNFSRNNLAVFRILCDLQYQGIRANLSFDLEKLFPGMSYYPRVKFENTIINPARWMLTKEEVILLVTKPVSLGRLHVFREQRGIPACISTGTGDQQLAFNLVNDQEAVFFLQYLNELKSVVLQEYLSADRKVLVGNKALAVQGMAILVKRKAVYKGIYHSCHDLHSIAVRRFALGSEWLYLKIYCTPQVADLLLTALIKQVLLIHQAHISSWFFIRYTDADSHLRLRIKITEDHVGLLLSDFQKFIHQQDMGKSIRGYHGDTYSRELERYSPELIEEIESSFNAGSELVLAILAVRTDDLPAEGEYLMAMSTIYVMALSFIDDSQITNLFFNQMADRFLKEFKGGKQLKIDLDNKYRAIKGDLSLWLKVEEENNALYTLFGKELHVLLDQIRSLSAASMKWDEGKRYQLIADLIHMQVNRFFSSKQRHHEMVIYYCLQKHGATIAGRLKQKAKAI